MPELPHNDVPPFRHEVPISEFDRVFELRKSLVTVDKLFDKPQEKPIAAGIIASEFLMHPDTPNELKPEAFKHMIDYMDNDAEVKQNEQMAILLIDSIRAQTDPGVRVRLASMVSHSLQMSYPSNFDTLEHGTSHLRSFMARRAAFMGIAASSEDRRVHSNWAKSLVSPKNMLSIFNELYERDSDVVMTPKIIEEISEETHTRESTPGGKSEGLQFTGDIVMLPLKYLPSGEKMEEYKREMGRELPIFLVRKAGGKFLSVQFPSDLSRRASVLAEEFRTQETPAERQRVYQDAQKLQAEFLERMHPDQRAAILSIDTNVEIRFSTTRDAAVKEDKTGSILQFAQGTPHQEYDEVAAD